MSGRSWRRLWRDWLSPALFALLLTQFGASAVRVDGVSMLPTLRHGELLALPKAEGWAHRLGLGGYHRGDLVVFKPPRTLAAEWRRDYRGVPLPWAYRPDLIKRVVGVPGDRVAMRAGRLYVNGRAVAEPRVLGYWGALCPDRASRLANTVAQAPDHTGLPETVVPPRTYFVMGDNRSPGGSLDSRSFGPVAAWDIEARAVASLWPLAARRDAVPACDGQPYPERRVRATGSLQPNVRLLVDTPR